ncbi:MAG: hypothetical protein ACFFDC_15570 [Promethearchaeota archaeon]
MIPQLDEHKQRILEKFRESNHFRLVFICSGNIIRSPYAHLLFEHLLEEDIKLKSKIQVESGGVTYRNYSISMETRNTLLKEGVPPDKISEFSPRYFPDHPDMFKGADLVLVMERNHIRKIPNKNTFLLLEFTLGKPINVPDPYFEPPYERSFGIIKEALIQLRELFNSD